MNQAMQNNEPWPIARALLSVSDKSGILELATGLRQNGVQILSTGGTAKLLSEQGIPVQEVSQHTEFPEIMDGRVKTLHPRIHGGILARHGVDEAVMLENKIDPIALIVVNLYPFAETIAKPDCTLEDAIENIDIGGPAMIRAAAKNNANVTIIVDPQDYAEVLQEISTNRGIISAATRFRLATKAFAHTAAYDSMIAAYLTKQSATKSNASTELHDSLRLDLNKQLDMRYGENPHQQAAFYTLGNPEAGSIAAAEQLQGKELSYNNIADTDAAIECVKQFSEPACVIVKHANPCGVAEGNNISESYDRAYSTDAESAFGGIIAFNRELDMETAEKIISRQFVEVIVAPSIAADALPVLETKKNVRVLTIGELQPSNIAKLQYKSVNGGMLVQSEDVRLHEDLETVSKRDATQQEMQDLLFAWKVAKYVKSNAIVYAKSQMTIGVGAGQMSRINSARIAGIKAEHANLTVMGSVMASDAFFPFRDGIDQAASAGIAAIIQPGGSMRDNEVIAAADEHDIAMIFSGMRHFRH